MKKIFAIFMAICLVVLVLCVTSAAAEPSPGTVIRVSGQKGDSLEVVGDYKDFEEGWNAAMKLAEDDDEMKAKGYGRVIVDLLADWTADDDGEFGDGDGFENYTIYFPEDVRVTLNMNGRTIDRDLEEYESDGEVMYVGEDADVIINQGTITGGWSSNGAGGIHVNDDARLTLNDVNIVGNIADDDDGGGIALYDGAELTMNGGSFIDNSIIGPMTDLYGGAIYIEDSTATLNGVEFKGNTSDNDRREGVVIYAIDSRVNLNKCTFEGNGRKVSNKSNLRSTGIFVNDSSLWVTECTFKNNGVENLIELDDAVLSVASSEFIDSTDACCLIKSSVSSSVYVTDTVFLNNKARALSTSGALFSTDISEDSFFKNCKFNNTKSEDGKTFANNNSPVTFYDCDFGDSVIESYVKVEKTVVTVTKAEAKIGVSGLLSDGTTSFTNYYKDLEIGWNVAMETAKQNLYDRVVVDVYCDWNADEDKEFGDGDGFDDYAIYFPENVRVTLNLNGHTVNRGLIAQKGSGEVMYVDENANVIINGGTISGGASESGAGGIHIVDGARVVLNDVNVKSNIVGGDDGSAIAVYDGAILIMNGGSISDNVLEKHLIPFTPIQVHSYGALYVNDATVTLNNVSLINNKTWDKDAEGVAIYATGSTVTMNTCIVSGNAKQENGAYMNATSVIAAYNSSLIITNTDFKSNAMSNVAYGNKESVLFYLEDSSLKMDGGKVTENDPKALFCFKNSDAEISGVSITDNASGAIKVDNESKKVIMTKCTLGNKSPATNTAEILVVTKGTLVMTDCILDGTTFADKSMVVFSDKATASILGGGSLTMIVSLLALATSVVSICVTVAYSKRKPASAAAGNTADAEPKE